MKVTVLGAGLIGGPIAADLAKDGEFSVTVCDINKEALKKLSDSCQVKTEVYDLLDSENVKKAAASCDIAVCAVPGFMGFRTLKAVIESGKNAVDIAFFPEDPFLLDEAARKENITVIVDCGVAPGMSNILTAHAASMLDEIDSAVTYVGGLPQVRHWPWEYRAVFSPADVIEEYTRPARIIENWELTVRPALSDPELIDFPSIGTLEAFNSDGLRTMIKTIQAKNMKEKTLRYPGHREKMLMLREAGFFSSEPLEINGSKVSPLDLTARLLFSDWKLRPGEEDLTVMQVNAAGRKNGRSASYRYDLLDYYDRQRGIHSMARVTGYIASMAVRLLALGMFTQKGIIPPEYIGRDGRCTDFMLQGLKQRGVEYRETTSYG